MENELTITAEAETLEARLAAAEAEIAELRANAAQTQHRKTQPTILTKQSEQIGTLEASALDAALSSLSLEQRITVKAQLMRSGLVF